MHKILRACVFCLCGAACVCLFWEPEVCTVGVQDALVLCAKTLVPSLLPFMVLSGFFLHSGLCSVCGARLSPLTARLFRLPGESAGILLLSMVGGFPVGIKMTAQILQDGLITQKQAARMCLFCINAGPAFVISAVGAELYNSARVGILLYGALCLSALTLGILLRFTVPKTQAETAKSESRVLHMQLATAFTQSVSEAMQSTLQICAWVALFGGIAALLEALPLPDSLHRWVIYTTEISNGVAAAAGQLPLPAVAALLSFSGFAIHCQVLADMTLCGVKYHQFFGARLLGAGFSALYCFLFLQIFPCEVHTFAGSAAVTHAAVSVSVPAGAALLLASILLLWEVDSQKKVCYNTVETKMGGTERNGKERKNRNCSEMRILRARTPLARRGNGALPQKGRGGKRQQVPKI